MSSHFETSAAFAPKIDKTDHTRPDRLKDYEGYDAYNGYLQAGFTNLCIIIWTSPVIAKGGLHGFGDISRRSEAKAAWIV